MAMDLDFKKVMNDQLELHGLARTDLRTPLDKEIAKVVERMTDLRQQKKDHAAAINDALKREQASLAQYAKAIKEGVKYLEDIDAPHNNS